MWNIPTKERLAKIPKIYETAKTPLQDKIIHLHFFIGVSDWFICEFDGDNFMWGFCILNNDLQNSEWGYISFQELKDININGIQVENVISQLEDLKREINKEDQQLWETEEDAAEDDKEEEEVEEDIFEDTDDSED